MNIRIYKTLQKEKTIIYNHQNIVFIGKTSFPVNSASSNRILTLGKGLTNAGAIVSVYSFGLSKLPLRSEGKNYSGSVSGINWMFFNKRVISFRCRFLNGIYLIWGQIKGYPLLLFRYFNKNPLFFTSQTSSGYIIPLWILSRICKGKMVLFRSEFPNHKIRERYLTRLIEKYIYPVTIARFDILFFMTDNLKEYFIKWADKKAVIGIIPVSVDTTMFKETTESPFPFPYIAYCGSLANTKDGLDMLIRCFFNIHKKFDDVRLVIIGGGPNLDTLRIYASKLFKGKEKVLFIGMVDHTKIPGYLLNASVLALARPNSIQAEGGFPSKLGEYLSTGKPVIVTDTGEISKYLKDGYNARIAKANDEYDFTIKLEWLLENPDEAVKIGINGRETATANFEMNKIGLNILKTLMEKS